jgi:small subunit ribosomal protein S8
MNTDPISDYLTRIRNAQMAGHRVVEIPASNMKKRITEILFDQGYITNFKFEDDNKQGNIKIALKYNAVSKLPAMKSINRVSSPGLRKYVGTDNLPKIINGLGIAILSTSRGVMTNKDAKRLKVGGEVICYIF